MLTPGFTNVLSRLRTAAHVALALAPSAIKVPIYRHVCGFKIAPGARIGLSVLDVRHLELEAGAEIGHGNVLLGSERVSLGKGARIGHLNLVRGGQEVRLDEWSWVMRLNVLNAIPDNDAQGTPDPRLRLGPGACVTSGHRLDFTDRIDLGKNVIMGGRNSSLWTHNRQATKPIVIGDFCYLGSEVRLAPGATLGPMSILGLGAVLTKPIDAGHVLVAGVPAKVVRQTSATDETQLRAKTRKDIPEDAY
jgi:acetyltransferase-like isoleucine patch superfamily enzyme